MSMSASITITVVNLSVSREPFPPVPIGDAVLPSPLRLRNTPPIAGDLFGVRSGELQPSNDGREPSPSFPRGDRQTGQPKATTTTARAAPHESLCREPTAGWLNLQVGSPSVRYLYRSHIFTSPTVQLFPKHVTVADIASSIFILNQQFTNRVSS